MTSEKSSTIRPRIILHGGAGNITRENLSKDSYLAYRNAMLEILQDAQSRLRAPGANALDIATYAVSLIEDNGLFNSGHGAVFTTAGTHELEASVMVSRGYRKRGVGVMKVTKAKNPIKLAREMLIRGEEVDGGGAQGHGQLEGETCDRLAEDWGLDLVKPSYFWTKRRWDEHRRGLGKKHDDDTYERHKRQADEREGCDSQENADDVREDKLNTENVIDETSWNGSEYLPQGTVGAVVLDSSGTICAATSTGGLTNKLPGRIGDTPTLGAGFWAEEWHSIDTAPLSRSTPGPKSPATMAAMFSDCLPGLSGYMSLPSPSKEEPKQTTRVRAVGMSGTGNGDSFLRLSAVRTAAAISRFSRNHPSESGLVPLQDAVSTIAGPDGMLQQSAEDRWKKTGEGEGGIIGIDFVDSHGKVVFDFNCGGMFRAWIDAHGKERFQVFRDDD